MLIDIIRNYVDKDLLVTARRVVRVHGTYPLGVIKIIKDDSSPKGWRATSLGSREDGEGCYDKAQFEAMSKDVAAVGDKENVIGVIYIIPYENIKDQYGDDQGNTLLVGIHVREDGKTYSDKKVLFYKTEALQGEKGEEFKDLVRKEYEADYLAGSDYEAGDAVSEILAKQKFEEEVWDGLCPRFLEVSAGGAWGDVMLSEHILPSPFTEE